MTTGTSRATAGAGAAGWTFADAWEAVADRFPDAPAQAGDRRSTWAEFDRRADGVARALLDAGLAPQAKVAQFLYNGHEYLESLYGCFKASFVPVNSNYRYTGDELVYLWSDADVEAVVFHGDLAERCAEVRARLPRVRLWLCADAGTGPCPDWAVPYEDVAAAGSPGGRVFPPGGRSGDDLFLLYTGGTTGKPKGVMWRQDTLFRMLEELNGRSPGTPAAPVDRAVALARPGPRVLPAAPLMHGTALWFSMPALSQGGCVVTSAARRFDPSSLLDVVVEERVKGLGIVGDAFARPLVAALDAEPGRWDLSALRAIFSSGVMFSPTAKAGMLRHAPNAFVVDSLGSSESGSLGRSRTGADEEPTGAAFRIGETTRVITDDGRDVVPGSGERGRLAISGHIPIGYYGDPEKTAETFVTVDGVVHVVAGDWAEVDADGTVKLLGRGSVCINTAGEKVYPEEVEEAVKRVAGVRDAVVVGVPDERFGESVTAVVEAEPGVTLQTEVIVAAVKHTLASYKAPRSVLFVDTLGRSPNGKADYRRWRKEAMATPGQPRSDESVV